MPINFSLQDVTGIFIGTSLFFFLLIPTGYVTCHFLDLFDFKSRKQTTKLGISLLISLAITPVLYFLAYRLVSEKLAFGILFIFSVVFFFRAHKDNLLHALKRELRNSHQIKLVLGLSIAWAITVTLSLMDIQFGQRLYFNITAYDYQTRVSVIDAISRTGVPPSNPSYFPGSESKLTFLYYFWYILCSMVDQLGGGVVSARTALIASVIWSGLATMGTIAFYLRLRNQDRDVKHWRIALLGVGLLAVSGLDIIGSTFYIIFPKYLYGYFIDGDIEHWNEQITAWIGTAMWAPHHLVSMLDCIVGYLLVVHHEKSSALKKTGAVMLSGLAFASAFGLSSWVTLIFIFFWLYWIITRLLRGERIVNLWIIFLPGLVAAISITPFILDLIRGSTGNGEISSLQALTFDTRWFRPILYFLIGKPYWIVSTINLLLLPVSYFFELGFFFLAGILWINLVKHSALNKNRFWKEEIALLVISAFLTSFTRSTLIANNDFGWRGWLPGQFILLVWGTDILAYYWKDNPINWKMSLSKSIKEKRIQHSLLALLILGNLTTTQDLVLLRIWTLLVDNRILTLPENIQSEEYNGAINFEARELFNKIDQQYPLSTIVQFNPSVGLNRATGLYRTRGVVFSFHTLYGLPEETYRPLRIKIAKIFDQPDANWDTLDTSCKEHKINILIIMRDDKLWNNIPNLANTREPIYQGNHYTAFDCGKFIATK